MNYSVLHWVYQSETLQQLGSSCVTALERLSTVTLELQSEATEHSSFLPAFLLLSSVCCLNRSSELRELRAALSHVSTGSPDPAYRHPPPVISSKLISHSSNARTGL